MNLEYYPYTFCLENALGEHIAFLKFVEGFAQMEGCKVDSFNGIIFDDAHGKSDVFPLSLPWGENLFKLIKNVPSLNLSVAGTYKGRPVSFVLTNGVFLAATRSDSDVDSIVADIRRHAL